jgi:hypothetical protein
MRDDHCSPQLEVDQTQAAAFAPENSGRAHSREEVANGDSNRSMGGNSARLVDATPTSQTSSEQSATVANATLGGEDGGDTTPVPVTPKSLEMISVNGPSDAQRDGDPGLITTRLDASDQETPEKERVQVPNIDFKSAGHVVEKSAVSERRGQGVLGGGRQTSARIYPVLNDSPTGRRMQEGNPQLTGRVAGALSKRFDIAASGTTGRRRSSAYSTLTKTLTLRTLQVSAQSSISAPVDSRQELLDPTRHRIMFLRTQKSLSDIFVKPTESHWRRRVNEFIFFWIIISIALMACETCDGPNFGSSDPGYPLLPTEAVYEALDTAITAVFSAELVGRVILNKFSRRIMRHPLTWIDLLALSPWYIRQIGLSAGWELQLHGGTGIGHQFSLVRLVRTLRLAHILRHYEQSKILFQSIKASLPPLAIILFFLFTLVMVLATALFYAEPCYNVNTCTFTDIFNSAYFIMLTYVLYAMRMDGQQIILTDACVLFPYSVATVGYGSQVPSLKNSGSLFITCIAMILGQIYFSMPVAIVGNNFERTYESFQMNKKQKLHYFDASLSPFDCLDIHAKVKRLCDIQYHTLNAWRVVHVNIDQSRRVGRAFGQIKVTEDMVVSQRAHHAKLMDAIERLMDVHTEACQLIQSFVPHKKKTRRATIEPKSKGLLKDMYSKAKQVIAKAKFPAHRYSAGMDARFLSQSAKGRLWLLLEVPDSSLAATTVNKLMVIFSLMSIMLFYLESLPELAASGVETSVCRKVVNEYCKSSGFSHLDPGCYLRRDNGISDYQTKLNFGCASTSDAINCYGAGLNFGSLNESALACDDTFLEIGVSLICYRQQCRTVATTIIDMTSDWIYIEWFFGTVFTAELILRFYISQDRRHFLKDFYIAFDVLAIVPFVVEVLQMMSGGSRPEYAIVATSPSFLSVIRVLKIMRILKLTRVRAMDLATCCSWS